MLNLITREQFFDIQKLLSSMLKTIILLFIFIFLENFSLKLANLLMHNSTVKIADFGFAKELYQKTSLTRTVLGTPYV